eukprot:scaffold4873_cov208-Pinguiococcus_pyrenoidosus.AAC.1
MKARSFRAILLNAAAADAEAVREPSRKQKRKRGAEEDETGEASAYEADVPEDLLVETEEDEDEEGADGFASALSKILSANIGDKKNPVLAKRRTKRMKEILKEQEEKKARRAAAQARRDKKSSALKVPDFSAAETERSLKKVATKGVVALFNAVAKYQHGVAGAGEKEADDGSKMSDAAKARFMTLLKTGITGGGKTDKRQADEEAGGAKPKWGALQKDYLMGAGMKDWDKDDEDDESPDDDDDDLQRKMGDWEDDDEDDPEDEAYAEESDDDEIPS